MMGGPMGPGGPGDMVGGPMMGGPMGRGGPGDMMGGPMGPGGPGGMMDMMGGMMDMMGGPMMGGPGDMMGGMMDMKGGPMGPGGPGGMMDMMGMMQMDSPSFDPNSRGREEVSVGLGVNYYIRKGQLKGHRFALEWETPVKEDFDGVQVKVDSVWMLGWQYAW